MNIIFFLPSAVSPTTSPLLKKCLKLFKKGKKRKAVNPYTGEAGTGEWFEFLTDEKLKQ